MLSKYIAKPLDAAIVQGRLSIVKSRLLSLDVQVSAYLFGSASRDAMDEHSDIDVYVIFKSEEDLKRSSSTLYSTSVECLFPIDWVLTTEEHHLKQSKMGGLAFDIQASGKIFVEKLK